MAIFFITICFLIMLDVDNYRNMFFFLVFFKSIIVLILVFSLDPKETRRIILYIFIVIMYDNTKHSTTTRLNRDICIIFYILDVLK